MGCLCEQCGEVRALLKKLDDALDPSVPTPRTVGGIRQRRPGSRPIGRPPKARAEQ